MQFQEAARFFANTKHLIEKVKEARLINEKLESKIQVLREEFAEFKSKYEAEKEQKEVLENETIKELTEKLSEMERRSQQFENIVSVLESEKAALSENYQKCQKYNAELEFKLKARETENSLQINQTELALSRLTALRSQLSQLQNNNEQIEDFLARFKSTVKLTNLKSLRDYKASLQKLEDNDKQFMALHGEIHRLRAENEALNSQVNLDVKMSQHAKAYYDEQLHAFERMKQKMETVFCTVEGTVTTAEQSGTLFFQLRTMLNNLSKQKDATMTPDKGTEESHYSENLDPGGPKDLAGPTSDNIFTDSMDTNTSEE